MHPKIGKDTNQVSPGTGKNNSGSSRSLTKTATLISNFKKSYRDIYYGRETIAVKSINELPGKEIGVKLVLCSPGNAFSRLLCSTGNKDFQKLQDNIIVSRFVDNAQSQEKIFVLKLVFTDGRTAGPYTIKIKYCPSKFYKAQKMEGYPNIIIISSEPLLNTGTGSIDDWVISRPTQEEKKFASRRWGRLIKQAQTNYDKAKILARTLMHDLFPHDGWPSDAMKVSPFKQYERMVSGRDQGFCSNFAEIFICACNALGIPARRIHLQEIYSTSDKCRIQLGSMHSTTEIFDEHLNQWIWMDLRFYALGAWLGNTGPLTLAEFHLFLNQSQRRKALKLLIYDMDNKMEKLLPLEKCPKKIFDCFLGWNTELHYSKLNGGK